MKILNFFSKYNKFIAVSGIILALLSILDNKLSASLALIVFLASVALFFINKIKSEKERRIVSMLFLISLFLHVLAVLVVFYGSFQPFSDGRGDYLEYNMTATEISERLSVGNFSLKNLPLGHYYAVVVGYLYFFTVPKMIIGELFNAWLVSLVCVLVYLIARQLGNSEKPAFMAGIFANVYPSLAFFGSLMLKEAFVVFFSTSAILLCLFLLKKFSWKTFVLLYLSLIGLTHFRFYISTVLVAVFIVCWFVFYDARLKQKVIYGGLMVFFLGFLPLISMVNGLEQGYFGINAVLRQLNIKTIVYYREVAYNFRVDPESGKPAELTTEKAVEIKEKTPEGVPVPDIVTNKDWGQDSSIDIKTGAGFLDFIINNTISFAYTFFGPFPWNIRYLKHVFMIPEFLFWWASLFFIVKGMLKSFKTNYKSTLPLLMFGIGICAMVSLYMTNFGLVTRIRIPAFVVLICLVPLGLGKLGNIKIPFIEKIFA